jgi:hypothetical protein
MNHDFVQFINGRWIKVGDLIVDLSSFEKGFQKEERSRKEIWDYIQYRESLLKWPSSNNPPSPLPGKGGWDGI